MNGAMQLRLRAVGWARTTLLVALVAIMSGCAGDAEPRIERVQLSGQITAPEGVQSSGTVYVSLYHAWALEGELRHPVEFIEAFETRVGSFSHDFDYPIDLGEGLLVYAWLDADGDGTLCTPTVRGERAGLIEVVDFVPGSVAADIQLTAPCAGPDWFYPVPE
jgi:hypothetical protein